MNTSLNNKGFSLIETLVVCVIVAILASVAIPLYIGYINNQRWTTVTNLAETAAAAGNAYWRRTGSDVTSPIAPRIAPLNLYYDSAKYQITVSGANITATDRSKTSITNTVGYK